jgi:hypothetical protein
MSGSLLALFMASESLVYRMGSALIRNEIRPTAPWDTKGVVLMPRAVRGPSAADRTMGSNVRNRTLAAHEHGQFHTHTAGIRHIYRAAVQKLIMENHRLSRMGFDEVDVQVFKFLVKNRLR